MPHSKFLRPWGYSLKKIKIMISSRCNDVFPAGGLPLSELRRSLKTSLEAELLFGEPLFEVWINELAPPADGAGDSTDVCLKAVDDADIVIVLSNGNAGWASTSAEIGICHAELLRAANTAAGKLRLISLGTVAVDENDQGRRNSYFQEYLKTQNLFRGGSVSTLVEAQARVKEAVLDAVTSLVSLGVRESRKGKFHTGEALAWSNLNFRDRQASMVDAVANAFADRTNGKRSGNMVTLPVAGSPVLFVFHGIPASLTVSAAREMVGRPFLQDFTLVDRLAAADGPVHVIGCQKGATEAQASALIGFPDATFVSTPFGVYVADNLQKVQFIFLQNCRDRTTTRFNAQRFFDWLTQSSEEHALVTRAKSRTRIVRAIEMENRTSL